MPRRPPIAIFTRIFTFLLLNLFLFGIILFCYEENYSESILCWCMAVAVSQATGKIFSVILNACGIDDTKTISFFNNKSPFWLDIGILILFHLIVFGTVAALFARRRKLQTESRTTIFVTLVATFSIIVIYVRGKLSFQKTTVFARFLPKKTPFLLIFRKFFHQISPTTFSHDFNIEKLNF